MKDLIAGTIFWAIVLGILFLLATIAEILSRVVTIDMIMNFVYVLLVISIIYIFKNA